MKALDRQEANREIVKQISKCVELFPNWRFNQILQNVGLEVPGQDLWFVESADALSNMMKIMNKEKDLYKCVNTVS